MFHEVKRQLSSSTVDAEYVRTMIEIGGVFLNSSDSVGARLVKVGIAVLSVSRYCGNDWYISKTTIAVHVRNTQAKRSIE